MNLSEEEIHDIIKLTMRSVVAGEMCQEPVTSDEILTAVLGILKEGEALKVPVTCSSCHKPREWDEPCSFCPPTEIRKCETCERTVQCTFEPDPFASEINDDHEKVWQCEKCRESSCDDI